LSARNRQKLCSLHSKLAKAAKKRTSKEHIVCTDTSFQHQANFLKIAQFNHLLPYIHIFCRIFAIFTTLYQLLPYHLVLFQYKLCLETNQIFIPFTIALDIIFKKSFID